MQTDQTDILSEVVSVLRLGSGFYFRAELGDGAAVRVPRERRHIRFHLALAGQCRLEVPGEPAIDLVQGEIALVPNGAEQVVSAGPEAVPQTLEALIAAGALRDGVLGGGGSPPRAVLLCGFLAFDDAVDHPLVDGLPALIHLGAAGPGAEPWVAAALRLLDLEAHLAGPGSGAVLSRLVEIVLIQAARRLAARPSGHGFVAALADPQLSQALRAIHHAPERAWRVGDLARLSAMSRATFAGRFAAAVGVPPAQYLTDWRLLRARTLLRDTPLDMAEIAERCGYASVPSFTRRFKERFGIGPGAFRRAGTVAAGEGRNA